MNKVEVNKSFYSNIIMAYASLYIAVPLPEVVHIEEHTKTVYAHHGLAMYLAQCLEHGLANALIFIDLIPQKAQTVRTREEWTAEFDSFMGRNFAQTLGRLIRNLHNSTAVPPELEEKLSQALKYRNRLAHHFFRERATEFMSASGRDSMIRELEAAQELFQTADDFLSSTIKPIREKYGFTDKRLEKFYTDYVSQIDHDL